MNFLAPDQIVRFRETLEKTPADAFVITGDIAEAPSLERFLRAIADAAKRPVYFVLGNHDFYRGSISRVRERMRELSREFPLLRWLPAAGVVELSPTTALVGHDGWADGRLGDYSNSTVLLNDYVLIVDLERPDRDERLATLERLGDEAAAHLRSVMPWALERYSRLVVATHVPPFKEATWHEGRVSDDDYLPHFSCKAMGDVLLEMAKHWPERRIDVLCGHTHGAGVARLLPNLTVWTGEAEYGAPAVQEIVEIQ
jgi:predicted phosphohydrolase